MNHLLVDDYKDCYIWHLIAKERGIKNKDIIRYLGKNLIGKKNMCSYYAEKELDFELKLKFIVDVITGKYNLLQLPTRKMGKIVNEDGYPDEFLNIPVEQFMPQCHYCKLRGQKLKL